MMENTTTILRRIQRIRKRKQRSLHDCAAFLNISKEDYLRFEKNAGTLTLPEVELLAVYLGVSPDAFFESDHPENQILGILDRKVQSQFLQLRHKMIQAKIASELQTKAIQLEKIQGQTEIPLKELEQYQSGEKPIPLDHLLEISQVLGLDINALVSLDGSGQEESSQVSVKNRWQPEFSADHNLDEAQEGDAYRQLLSALQALPRHDRAEIAKLLLTKLKSIKNG